MQKLASNILPHQQPEVLALIDPCCAGFLGEIFMQGIILKNTVPRLPIKVGIVYSTTSVL